MQTGLTPKPAATSYGEGFVFRVYQPVVQLRVVVCRGLEEGEEVVVTHHAITGTIPSHRIIFMCVPRGCPKVFRRRSLISVALVQQGYRNRRPCASGFFFRQIRWLPSLSLQDSTAMICLFSYTTSRLIVEQLPYISSVVRHRCSTALENPAIDSIW